MQALKDLVDKYCIDDIPEGMKKEIDLSMIVDRLHASSDTNMLIRTLKVCFAAMLQKTGDDRLVYKSIKQAQFVRTVSSMAGITPAFALKIKKIPFVWLYAVAKISVMLDEYTGSNFIPVISNPEPDGQYKNITFNLDTIFELVIFQLADRAGDFKEVDLRVDDDMDMQLINSTIESLFTGSFYSMVYCFKCTEMDASLQVTAKNIKDKITEEDRRLAADDPESMLLNSDYIYFTSTSVALWSEHFKCCFRATFNAPYLYITSVYQKPVLDKILKQSTKFHKNKIDFTPEDSSAGSLSCRFVDGDFIYSTSKIKPIRGDIPKALIHIAHKNLDGDVLDERKFTLVLPFGKRSDDEIVLYAVHYIAQQNLLKTAHAVVHYKGKGINIFELAEVNDRLKAIVASIRTFYPFLKFEKVDKLTTLKKEYKETYHYPKTTHAHFYKSISNLNINDSEVICSKHALHRFIERQVQMEFKFLFHPFNSLNDLCKSYTWEPLTLEQATEAKLVNQLTKAGTLYSHPDTDIVLCIDSKHLLTILYKNYFK